MGSSPATYVVMPFSSASHRRSEASAVLLGREVRGVAGVLVNLELNS